MLEHRPERQNFNSSMGRKFFIKLSDLVDCFIKQNVLAFDVKISFHFERMILIDVRFFFGGSVFNIYIWKN